MEASRDHQRWLSVKESRRWLLRGFLGSIAVNAGLGIWALLAGDFGQVEAKVLATSLLVSGAMLSILVNGAPLERRVLWPLPVVAAVTASGSLCLVIGLMWAEIDNDAAAKVVFSGLIVAAGATLSCLLALVALSPQHEPLRLADYGLIALFGLTALWGLWGEVDRDWYGRVLGIESVLVAAATVAIPVLGRFRSDVGLSTGAPSGRPAYVPAYPITIGSLVSRPAVSVDRTATLRILIDRFSDQGASFAVVGDSLSVAGVVSATDVLLAIHDGADIDEVTVAEAMSEDVVAADADATLHEGARLMTENGIRQLLVLGDRGGVVSIVDVLAAMAEAPDPIISSDSSRGPS